MSINCDYQIHAEKVLPQIEDSETATTRLLINSADKFKVAATFLLLTYHKAQRWTVFFRCLDFSFQMLNFFLIAKYTDFDIMKLQFT